MLRGRAVAVGVSGSIAAYKCAQIVRLLVSDGAEVRVVMTHGATQFVSPATFAALSGSKVLVDVFDEPHEVAHVELGRWAEVYLLGATTATTLARLAQGDASDAVSASYLMFRGTCICAPAMHSEMWDHDATQRNVEVLQSRGVEFVGPEQGDLASGDWGIGRMAEPEQIVERVRAAFCDKDFSGKRVVVTAGPTREPIDSVRFISNRSSGLMGICIATEALRRGASVTMICGPIAISPPPGVELVRVETASEMHSAVTSVSDHADVLFMAAAVADFSPVISGEPKVRKPVAQFSLDVVPTIDIAKSVSAGKSRLIKVLFAAQTSDEVNQARRKLVEKGGDLIVANTVGQQGTGFDSPTNRAWIIDHSTEESLGVVSKQDLARMLCDRIAKLWGPTR